ncbi:hypothetical protein ABXJ76_05860 [Methylobacter sp. G7]|uniref:hypothetical protein n=1 Tax=Methylobacter sp. G7 TaxID=3230117 RepID=UPI003D804640
MPLLAQLMNILIISFEEYPLIEALLSQPKKIVDFLAYLHQFFQMVKQVSSKRFTLAEVKQACDFI